MLSLAVTIAWALWTRRHEKRNGRNFPIGLMLVQWSGNYIKSFKFAASATSALVLTRPQCSQACSPPVASMFKVNVDALTIKAVRGRCCDT